MCLAGTARHVRAGRGDPRDTAVGGVVHVVEAGYVREPAPGQLEERLLAVPAFGLGGAQQVGDAEDRLLPVAEHDGVEEVGDRLGVERGMAAGDDERMLTRALARLLRDSRKVERDEEVGVAELGREADAQHVERADRAVALDRELADAVLAHERLEIGPDAVGAFGEDAGLLVQHLVQDHHALVGQADLVRVGIHQAPPHVSGVPIRQLRVQLTADVLHGLAHLGQQRLEARPERFDRHGVRG